MNQVCMMCIQKKSPVLIHKVIQWKLLIRILDTCIIHTRGGLTLILVSLSLLISAYISSICISIILTYQQNEWGQPILYDISISIGTIAYKYQLSEILANLLINILLIHTLNYGLKWCEFCSVESDMACQ